MPICPFFPDVSGTSTSIKTETVECRRTECQVWNAAESNCSMAVTAKMTLHIHEGHLHSSPHAVTVTEGVAGEPTVPSSLPYAAILAQEYACFQDSDGNGKVFGRDFAFIEDDYLPPALSGVQKNPDIIRRDLPKILWKDLYAWRYNSGADPLINVPARE